MYQLGKILFILNVLRLKEFIHLWAELFSLRSLSYIIFFNLKGQGLNSCFAIQSKKMAIFLSFFIFTTGYIRFIITFHLTDNSWKPYRG